MASGALTRRCGVSGVCGIGSGLSLRGAGGFFRPPQPADPADRQVGTRSTAQGFPRSSKTPRRAPWTSARRSLTSTGPVLDSAGPSTPGDLDGSTRTAAGAAQHIAGPASSRAAAPAQVASPTGALAVPSAAALPDDVRSGAPGQPTERAPESDAARVDLFAAGDCPAAPTHSAHRLVGGDLLTNHRAGYRCAIGGVAIRGQDAGIRLLGRGRVEGARRGRAVVLSPPDQVGPARTLLAGLVGSSRGREPSPAGCEAHAAAAVPARAAAEDTRASSRPGAPSLCYTSGMTQSTSTKRPQHTAADRAWIHRAAQTIEARKTGTSTPRPQVPQR
jgi:hypothetical protein